ncbi:13352_t:CDS:2, partial [Funneliformis mosseae]
QNAKIKASEIDIQPLIQELLIEPLEENCVKVVNMEEIKQDEIMSWYCYRKYFEKRHSEILPGILKNRLITNKKAYKLTSGQIYDEILHEIGEDKIMRIKTYSVNKLSKLINMQIDIIKTILYEKNSRTHVTSEMIISDATASAKSKVRIPIASTNSSDLINSPVILYDACAPYINVTLNEYPYLFLYNSDRYNDAYKFKNSDLCLEC